MASFLNSFLTNCRSVAHAYSSCDSSKVEVEVAGSLGWVALVGWAEGEGEVEVEAMTRRDGRRRSSGSGEPFNSSPSSI